MIGLQGRQNTGGIVDSCNSSIKLLLCLIAGAGMLWSTSTFAEKKTAEKKTVVKKYSAVARKSMDIVDGGLPQKLDFKFDNAVAWLKENGEFNVEAEIKHSGLLCGDYEVGIHFGIGGPACANVSWIGEPYYISHKKQCNNAWMVHSGSGVVAEIKDDFAQISCAQLLIKCTGKCE